MSARSAARRISTAISEADLFVGAQGTCERCGELVVWRELTAGEHSARFWSDCTCWLEECDRAARLSRSGAEAQVGKLLERVQSDVRAIQHFTLDAFNPSLLTNGEQLVRAARRWLQNIEGKPVGDYHNGPAVALYFHSPGKGRGKTHLAGAMAMDAYRNENLIAFADEVGFIDRIWSAPLEERASLTSVPSQRAWLTVLDGLGDRENTPASLRDAWYSLINPRWLKCGWTIITSNYTPDELLARGTIDERAFSRLMQMTRGNVIEFDGQDQRLSAAHDEEV